MLEHQHRHLDRSVIMVADVRVDSVASVGRDVEASAGCEVSGHAVVKVFDLRRAPDVLALVEDRTSVAVVARHTPAGEGQHARDVVSLRHKTEKTAETAETGFLSDDF